MSPLGALIAASTNWTALERSLTGAAGTLWRGCGASGEVTSRPDTVIRAGVVHHHTAPHRHS
jgi:hypothetical protein